MRRIGIIGLLVGFVAAMLSVATPAQAYKVGNEGCTPGYWKNHTDNWYENVDSEGNFTDPIPTTKKLAPALVPSDHRLANTTFLDALNFGGGPGLEGAEQILLRAAVAAWLNAAHEGLGYPLRRGELQTMVYAALATGDRDTILELATYLDDLNNSPYGCPLN
jgi:hypothetical protein